MLPTLNKAGNLSWF